jgi:spermidine/putrescine-binding protein
MRPLRATSTLTGLSATAAALLCLSACGGSGAQAGVGNGKPTGTLRIIAESEVLAPAMLGPFKRANPGLKIETDEVEGSSEAGAKLSAGFNADVVETCADESNLLTRRGLLQPIDTSRLTHWRELSPTLRSAEGAVVAGKLVFLPGQAGPTGLVYNTKDFPHGVDEDKELFNPALKGRVALDVGGDDKSMIAMTAFALGVKNPFHMSEAQLERVGKYLIAHAGQFRTFPDSDANELNLMKTGEVILTDEDLGAVHEMLEAHIPVKWVRPKEGYYSWTCGLAITKNAKNLNAAYAFLNYYSSPEAQAVFGNEGYTITNEKALPKVKPALRATADPAALQGATIEQSPANPSKWFEIYQQVVGG